MFDVSWIRDDLAVGGALPAGDLISLKSDHGIHAVIDVRTESRDEADALNAVGVRHLHLPTRDFGAVTPAMLDQGVRWITRALTDGGRVLVHCQLGIGRSVLLILCFLVKQGRSAPDAMLLVKDRRPQASPSLQQIEALIAYEQRVTGVRSDFNDVARHAYRHLPHWKNAE